MRHNFKENQRVYWTDPDKGFGSGPGRVTHIQHDGDDGDDAVITIFLDDAGEVECYAHELTSLDVKAKHVTEMVVTDPDSNAPVHVAIYKMNTGGMIGIDSSFLDQAVGPVFSPYDGNVMLDLEG